MFRLILALGAALCGWSDGLTLLEPAVLDIPSGIGVPEDHEFAAGQKVYLTFRVAGFKTLPAGNTFLEYWIEPVDCLGIPFEKAFEGRLIATARRAEARPIVFDFTLPPAPWPGESKFRIVIRDRIAETELRSEVPFRVTSNVSEVFDVSGFRMFTYEYSDEPVRDAVFPPGATIWCRFSLSGFQLEENNRYRLSYGVTLRNRAGRVVFAESQAAMESRESFYPKWRVDGLIGVRLERTIRPGDYTLAIAATDDIGKQKTAAEFPLTIR